MMWWKRKRTGRATQAGIKLTLVLLLFSLAVSGCQRGASESGNVQMDLAVSPTPPVTGPASIEISLWTKEGEPISGAQLRIEGNMSHAGMEPVFADAQEQEVGRFVADDFEFTMEGDWIVTVSGTLADDTKVEQSFDVPGVGPGSSPTEHSSARPEETG